MKRPNVVIILADQHRWDFVGYERNGVTLTPNIDRLAARGTVFHSAYCTSPLCMPSRAAITAGRYGMNTGCFTNLHELPPGTPTFIQQFRQAGYHTCAIGKTHMEIHAYDSDLLSERHRALMDSLGWDEIHETAGDNIFRHGVRCAYSEHLREHGRIDEAVEFHEQWSYFMETGQRAKADPSFVCHEWTLPEMCHGTAFVGQTTLDWLRSRDQAQPFLLHVGFSAPHSPIAPLPASMDPYRELEESPAWGQPDPPPWLADGRRGYRAMISQIDAYVGRICECLADQGRLDDTVIVYASDHGEMAGDHGLYGKTTFYEGAVRVPLVFAGPGIRADQENSALVEMLDLGRTLCDLCSVEPHTFDQGRSVAPVLAEQSMTHRTTLYCEMGCDRMLRNERYKLMWGEPSADTRQLGRLHLDKPVNIPPSPPRLYDLVADPHELNDLFKDGSHQNLLMEMLEQLLTRINENTQPQPNKSRGAYHPLRSRSSQRQDGQRTTV